MRIAYLCKRHYMGKDVILDRYARLYEIPRQLALLGHDVEAFCMSYRHDDAGGPWPHEAAPGRLAWIAKSPRSLPTYPWTLLARLRRFKPDVVIAASDIPHVALGAWLAKRLRRPFVADLYDNFEGFGQARIPGAVTILRKAVRSADLVLTTSEPLRQFVVDVYRPRGEVVAMPSTVDKAIFHPQDRAAAREALGLPHDALLVGTAGGLNRAKGIAGLYEAWALLAQRVPNAHLVLAGPHEASLPPPSGERVHSLGPLPHSRIATLFAALDVGAICILDTPFGRYCFPQKAYEMLACRLPVVAADVGAMGALFAASPESLYRAEDAADLAAKLEVQLTLRRIADVPIEDWSEVVRSIEPRIRRLTG